MYRRVNLTPSGVANVHKSHGRSDLSDDQSQSAALDTLSALGRQLIRLDAASALNELVVGDKGNSAAAAVLESLSSRELIDGPIISPADADAVLAGLWLRHDWLEPAHRIAQQIESASGSLWHAIIHRREGDFSNSKYWYRRTEKHPIFDTLTARASDAINPFPADKTVFRIVANGWNPAAFVDLIQAVQHQPADHPLHRLAINLQQVEWRTLFEFCTRAASGK